MSLTENLVTKSDLVSLGFYESDGKLPDNVEKLIRYATDIVIYMVKKNYDPTSDKHVLAVKMAICSQVSYWDSTGTNPENDSVMSSYTLGSLSVSVDTSKTEDTKASNMLCPMSRIYLNNAYLLYRGLRHGRI